MISQHIHLANIPGMSGTVPVTGLVICVFHINTEQLLLYGNVEKKNNLLSNYWVKGAIKYTIKDHLKNNENVNNTYENI